MRKQGTSEGVIISHLGVTGAKTVILKAEKRRQKPGGGCCRGSGESNKEGLERGRALKPCPGNRTRALAGHLVGSLSPSPFNIISQWRAVFFLLNEQTIPTSVGSEGPEANTFINQFPVFAHINPNKPPPTLIFSTFFFLSRSCPKVQKYHIQLSFGLGIQAVPPFVIR